MAILASHPHIIDELYDHIGMAEAWRTSFESYLALMQATTYSVGLCENLEDMFHYMSDPASLNLEVGREPIMLANNVSENYFAKYPYYFDEGDPIAYNTIEMTRAKSEGVVVDINTDLKKFKIYEELAVPNGMASVLNVWSDNKMNDARNIQLAFFREDPEQAFTAQHVAMVESDMIHLKRTIYLHCQALEMQSRIAKLESVMDCWQTGLLFCNTHGRLLHANHRGRELLSENEFPVLYDFLGSGVLHARRSEKLKLAFMNAVSGMSSCVALPSKSEKQDAGIIIVALGVQPLSNYGLYTNDHGVVFIIIERKLSANAAVNLAKQAYKLSNAESKLLLALVQGITPNEYANKNNVKITTVRSQISNLLAKTKTKRQQELMVIISRMMGW